MSPKKNSMRNMKLSRAVLVVSVDMGQSLCCGDDSEYETIKDCCGWWWLGTAALPRWWVNRDQGLGWLILAVVRWQQWWLIFVVVWWPWVMGTAVARARLDPSKTPNAASVDSSAASGSNSEWRGRASYNKISVNETARPREREGERLSAT